MSPRGDWLDRDLDVYVPAPGVDHILGNILPRSGIVGTAEPGLDRVMVDYEGNKFSWPRMDDWVARVERAAMRHAQRYPTIARMWVPPDAVTLVGTYDGIAVWVEEPDALTEYLNHHVLAGRLERLDLPNEPSLRERP